MELGDDRFASSEELYDRLPEDVRSGFFVFGFLRHPVPRFLSGYQEISLRVEGDPRESKGKAWEAMPEGMERLAEFLAEAERRLGDSHVRRQSEYLRGVRYDFLGRVETFQSDLARVYDRLGLGALAVLPRRRSREGRAADWGYARHWHLPEDLPEELVTRIESLYRDDLDLWMRLDAGRDGAARREVASRGDWEPPSVVRASEPGDG